MWPGAGTIFYLQKKSKYLDVHVGSHYPYTVQFNPISCRSGFTAVAGKSLQEWHRQYGQSAHEAGLTWNYVHYSFVRLPSFSLLPPHTRTRWNGNESNSPDTHNTRWAWTTWQHKINQTKRFSHFIVALPCVPGTLSSTSMVVLVSFAFFAIIFLLLWIHVRQATSHSSVCSECSRLLCVTVVCTSTMYMLRFDIKEKKLQFKGERRKLMLIANSVWCVAYVRHHKKDLQNSNGQKRKQT